MTNQMISVTIDGIECQVENGTSIRDAAQSLGIHIPTLCHHSDLCAAGICRICVVEIKGRKILQASCSYPITQSIDIITVSKKVRKARRNIIDLLLSRHHGECYSCVRSENCELQSLAAEYGVDSFRFGHPDKARFTPDSSGCSIYRDMDLCILCRRCVRTCLEIQEIGALATVNRGPECEIAAFAERPLKDVACINCGQCINRCPTAALKAIDTSDAIWDAIDDPEKHVVVQTAPSPRAGIGEEFGKPPGTPLTFEMNTALRAIGFDKVFDTNFTADLTIIEEATELLQRLYNSVSRENENLKLPQFTSCSPGWVKFLEHFYPEFLDNLSTCKSPQQMFGAVLKTRYAELQEIDPGNIVTVALMPCTAKKYECDRPEMNDSGFKDVDYGVTTREMAQMFREAGIDLPSMKKSDFDSPFGTATGSGVIFGATGGVMESALRSALELIIGKPVEDLYEHAEIIPLRGFEGVKYAELTLPEKLADVPDILKNIVSDFDFLSGVTLKVGVAHGIANARLVLEDIKAGGKFSECHFIEFMACPGGCLGGGGQPIPTSKKIREERAKAIYAEDKKSKVRKSYQNPAVADIYETFLTDGPCGEKSHKLLHTHYTKRGTYIR